MKDETKTLSGFSTLQLYICFLWVVNNAVPCAFIFKANLSYQRSITTLAKIIFFWINDNLISEHSVYTNMSFWKWYALP